MKKSKLKQLIIEIIKEAKQVGDIYHFTSINALETIIKTNALKNSHSGVVSLTRNKNLIYNNKHMNLKLGGQIHKISVRITLDGDKLSNKYKINPHKDNNFRDKKDKQFKNKGTKIVKGKYYTTDESEEIIRQDVTKLDEYIKEIYIYDPISEYKYEREDLEFLTNTPITDKILIYNIIEQKTQTPEIFIKSIESLINSLDLFADNFISDNNLIKLFSEWWPNTKETNEYYFGKHHPEIIRKLKRKHNLPPHIFHNLKVLVSDKLKTAYESK